MKFYELEFENELSGFVPRKVVKASMNYCKCYNRQNKNKKSYNPKNKTRR